MKPYITTFLAYNIFLLIGIPSVAMYVDDFHPLADIARMIEGPILHFSMVAFILALFLMLFGAGRVGVFAIICTIAAAIHAIMLLEQPVEAKISAGREIKILSVNIEGKYGRDKRALYDNIIASNADIVLILEADAKIRELLEASRDYPYQLPCDVKTCDNVVVSKIPIASYERYKMAHIWASPRISKIEFELDSKTKFHFIGTHLTKAWIPESYYERRRVTRMINKVQGPIVVAGDFNAAPWSYQLRKLASDTGLYFKRLPPATWHTKAGDFGIPIDHVAVRGAAQLISLEAWNGAPHSNHRGLLARIKVGEN